MKRQNKTKQKNVIVHRSTKKSDKGGEQPRRDLQHKPVGECNAEGHVLEWQKRLGLCGNVQRKERKDETITSGEGIWGKQEGSMRERVCVEVHWGAGV